MNKDQKLAILHTWQSAYKQLDSAWQSFTKTTVADFESPLGKAYWNTFDLYTDVVATLVDDKGGWLDWYRLENDWGKRGGKVSINKKSKHIKTLTDLIWCIEP